MVWNWPKAGMAFGFVMSIVHAVAIHMHARMYVLLVAQYEVL